MLPGGSVLMSRRSVTAGPSRYAPAKQLFGRRKSAGVSRSIPEETTQLVFRVLPLPDVKVSNSILEPEPAQVPHQHRTASPSNSILEPAPAQVPRQQRTASLSDKKVAGVKHAPSDATTQEATTVDERLEASVRSELLKLEFGAAEQSSLTDRVASKYEVVTKSLNTKFNKLAEEQDQLQHHTAGIAKQLHTALLELEKLLADRLFAEQQAVQADVELQQSVLQLEVVTAQRDVAVEQAHKLKTALQLWEGKNQKLAGQLRVAKQDVADLSESRAKLESHFLDLYNKREELQRRVADAEEVAEQAQHQVHQLQQQVSHLSADLSRQSTHASQLSSQLALAHKELEQAVSHQRQLGSLLDETQQDTQLKRQQLNVERQRVEALKAQVASESSWRHRLQLQLEALQQQVADLQSSSAATHNQLSTQLADSQRYTSRLRQQLQQTTYQHDMISDSNHKLLQRLEVAEQEVKGLNEQLGQAMSAASQQHISTSAPAMAEAAAVQDQLESTTTALHAVDQERKVYAISNQQLRQQVTQLGVHNQQLSAERAELQKQVERLQQQQQLEAVNSWLAGRSTLMAVYSQRHVKRHSTMALVEFANNNRFWVPEHVRVRFLKTWMDREQQMLSADGFLGLGVQEQGQEVCVSSLWLSVATWESWALSASGRRSHLPDGVQQYVPQKGAGFPEDFVPFKDYTDAVAARYE